jgi:hypothetical protein
MNHSDGTDRLACLGETGTVVGSQRSAQGSQCPTEGHVFLSYDVGLRLTRFDVLAMQNAPSHKTK